MEQSDTRIIHDRCQCRIIEVNRETNLVTCEMLFQDNYVPSMEDLPLDMFAENVRESLEEDQVFTFIHGCQVVDGKIEEFVVMTKQED